MDIGLFAEVDRVRGTILDGRLYDGIQQLFSLKKTGYPVHADMLGDIVDIPRLLLHLYDETTFGDVLSAVRCLAALKSLGAPVEAERVDYVRYKKLALMEKDLDGYFRMARPVMRRLLSSLASFHAQVGQYRECTLRRESGKALFEEEAVVRFPNSDFRDALLQAALPIALKKRLEFHWEPVSQALHGDRTGRLRWSMVFDDKDLPENWFRAVKPRFDEFVEGLLERLDSLVYPRFLPLNHSIADLPWVVFSRDTSVLRKIGESLEGFASMKISDLDDLRGCFGQDEAEIGAFVFHITSQDFDVIHELAAYKLGRNTMGPPCIVLADEKLYKAMRDPAVLFPGCELVSELNRARLDRLGETVSKVRHNRRRFLRLPVSLDCEVRFLQEGERTRATPVSPGGAFLRTHRTIPLFREAEISLRDDESGFCESLRGSVIYNQRSGAAVRFDNVVSFREFQKLREICHHRQKKAVDTLQRSCL